MDESQPSDSNIESEVEKPAGDTTNKTDDTENIQSNCSNDIDINNSDRVPIVAADANNSNLNKNEKPHTNDSRRDFETKEKNEMEGEEKSQLRQQEDEEKPRVPTQGKTDDNDTAAAPAADHEPVKPARRQSDGIDDDVDTEKLCTNFLENKTDEYEQNCDLLSEQMSDEEVVCETVTQPHAEDSDEQSMDYDSRSNDMPEESQTNVETNITPNSESPDYTAATTTTTTEIKTASPEPTSEKLPDDVKDDSHDNNQATGKCLFSSYSLLLFFVIL